MFNLYYDSDQLKKKLAIVYYIYYINFTAYNYKILKLNAKDKDLGENSEMIYESLNGEDICFLLTIKELNRLVYYKIFKNINII